MKTVKPLRLLAVVMALALVLVSILMINSTRETLLEDEQDEPIQPPAVELNVVHWVTLPGALLDKFQAENPDVKVNYMQYNINAYDKAALVDLLPMGGIDVLGVQEKDYAALAMYDLTVDLTDEGFMARVAHPARSAVAQKHNGREYAMPLSSTYYGMWYNKSMFQQYGLTVPETYDDFVAVCEVLLSRDIPPVVLGAKDDESAFMSFLISMKENSWKNSYANVDEYRERANQLIEHGYIHELSADLTYQQAFEMFKKGQVAMFPAPDHSISMCGMDMEKVMEPGVFVIPYSNTYQKAPCILADNLVAVNAHSQKKEQALAFLDFLSRSDVAMELTRENGWHSAMPAAQLDLPYAREWDALRGKRIMDLSELMNSRSFVQGWAREVKLKMHQQRAA